MTTCLAATGPLAPTDERPVGRTPTIRRLLDQRALIDELWRISHFGWIPEVAIRQALTLAGEHKLSSDSLHQGLRQLLERGCLEHDDSGAESGEHQWRLPTPAGRPACSERGRCETR